MTSMTNSQNVDGMESEELQDFSKQPNAAATHVYFLDSKSFRDDSKSLKCGTPVRL